MASGLVGSIITNKEYLVYGFIRSNYKAFITTDLIDLCYLFYSNNMNDHDKTGYVQSINDAVIKADNMLGSFMYELVVVGKKQLVGEIIKLDGKQIYIQMYYDLKLVSIGDIVIRAKTAFSLRLGPGLLGNVFDGMQRPLNDVTIDSHTFMSALDRNKLWHYQINDTLSIGDKIYGGHVIGTVYENKYVPNHKILVPAKICGQIISITECGKYDIDEPLMIIKHYKTGKNITLTMTHFWPVRFPRPCNEKKIPTVPLLTGQRVLDCLFPMVMGGSCAVVGAHGTGKTVLLQSISKYSNCDIIIFVLCGQRGNEVGVMLKELLMDKCCLVVNTSDMPIAKCEAVIYTGLCIAEYYRDQGLNVGLMIDGISQWAGYLERLNECMPTEIPSNSGYPSTYIDNQMCAMYERAGYIECLGSDQRNGSLSIIGSVSPIATGGDFTDPLVSSILWICQVFWAFDKCLAEKRCFPALNCLISFTKYNTQIEQFYDKNYKMYCEYIQYRKSMQRILKLDNDLIEIVKLVGKECLSECQKMEINVAKIIREDFVQQDVYSEYDYYCPLEKMFGLLECVLMYYEKAMFYVNQSDDSVGLFTTAEVENHCKDLILKIISIKMDILPNSKTEEIQNYFQELKEEIITTFATIGKLEIDFITQ